MATLADTKTSFTDVASDLMQIASPRQSRFYPSLSFAAGLPAAILPRGSESSLDALKYGSSSVLVAAAGRGAHDGCRGHLFERRSVGQVSRSERSAGYAREVRRGAGERRTDMNLMAERAELLGRYRRLRALMRDLHSELTRMVPKDTLTQCARKLGLLVHDTLVFDSEEEMSVLMDYCIYDGWVGQHNAVTRFLAKQPYAAGTDQALLLDGMSRARYSLFQVESVAEGVGINCRDVLRGDGGTIVDEGLGNTASHAVVFAGRLVVLPELGMTTGAVLGVDADTLADIVNVLENEAEGVGGADINNLTPPEAAALSSLIIRCVLGRGTPARDAPQEPGRSAETRQPRQSGGERPSRNEPCPCGSGRKYKRCCGRAEQPGA